MRNTDDPVTAQKKRMAKASLEFKAKIRRKTPNIGRPKCGIRIPFRLSISSFPSFN